MAGYLGMYKVGLREFLNTENIPEELALQLVQHPRGTFHRNSSTVPGDDDRVVAGVGAGLH